MDSIYLNTTIAALEGIIQGRRITKPWKVIGSALGNNAAFGTKKARTRLKEAITFAANVCATYGLDPNFIRLKLDDNQRSDGCIIKAIGQSDVPMEIHLRSRLFTSLSGPACLFVIAHEFGHILNGDTNDEKILQAIQKDQEVDFSNLSPLQLRDRAHESHRAELAANATAVRLFPTIAKGVAAGIAAFTNGASINPYTSIWVRKPIDRNSAEYRYHTHPSRQLCIRMLKRLAAQPK